MTRQGPVPKVVPHFPEHPMDHSLSEVLTQHQMTGQLGSEISAYPPGKYEWTLTAPSKIVLRKISKNQ
jgi:hypothetical protein